MKISFVLIHLAGFYSSKLISLPVTLFLVMLKNDHTPRTDNKLLWFKDHKSNGVWECQWNNRGETNFQ